MNILLGKQAILNRDKQIIAYELLFRSIDNSPIISDTNATANVVANTLSMFDAEQVLGNKKGFINIGIEILRMGVLDILPPSSFVIEILETQTPSPELVHLIQELKKKKFTIALDDFILNKENIEYWRSILNEVDIVKVDIMETPIDNLESQIHLLKDFNVELLAEKVEDSDTFDFCLSLGFQYFQGYFFTKPVIIQGQSFTPNIQGIMQTYRLLEQDADIPVIEDTIKHFPDISISLLKIVNSASIGPRQKITSIRQTIALLGKKAISKWLILLMYSQNPSEKKSFSTDPIFLSAAQRGKMAELILQTSPYEFGQDVCEEAFLAGLLSLSDVPLRIPLTQLLQELNISENIQKGILNYEGSVGHALELILSYEQKEYDKLYRLCTKLKITVKDLNEIVHTAWKFSNDLANSL